MDSDDRPYFSSFLSLFVNVAFDYSKQFPSIIPNIIVRSTHHEALRLSIVSMSALLLDLTRQLSLTRFYTYRLKATSLIQSSISTSVDEGVALSVFLFIFMDYICGDLGFAAHHHIKGLSLIIEDLGMRDNSTPLLLLVKRIVLRMDFHYSFWRGVPPTCHPLSTDEIYNQPPWVEWFAPDVQTAQWAHASLALDALWRFPVTLFPWQIDCIVRLVPLTISSSTFERTSRFVLESLLMSSVQKAPQKNSSVRPKILDDGRDGTMPTLPPPYQYGETIG